MRVLLVPWESARSTEVDADPRQRSIPLGSVGSEKNVRQKKEGLTNRLDAAVTIASDLAYINVSRGSLNWDG